ncbi:MAG: hypothetical protein J1E61_02325 [Lachnospiraceae bacterium]|nr:hypothetical protein [Lachnospiraceae bacterium]
MKKNSLYSELFFFRFSKRIFNDNFGERIQTKIKDITKITNRIETIDEEEAYVLDRHMIDNLDELSKILKHEKGKGIMWDVEFIRNRRNFDIIFTLINKRHSEWVPCLIYKYEGEWRRVKLENAQCLKCDWTGIVANPSNSSLFECMENWSEITCAMKKLPSRKCPICGSELSRHAIWINGYDED